LDADLQDWPDLRKNLRAASSHRKTQIKLLICGNPVHLRPIGFIPVSENEGLKRIKKTASRPFFA
jgi:hypothetical protein